MIEFEATIQCQKCKDKVDIEDDGFHFICDNCIEIKEENDLTEIGKEIFEILNEKAHYIVDGSDLIGFKSEEEKIAFLRGAKYGYTEALWELNSNFFGNEMDKEWEQLVYR